MPGKALARGPISLILADSSERRDGSTLKLVTRAYMGVLLRWRGQTPRADRAVIPLRRWRGSDPVSALQVSHLSVARTICGTCSSGSAWPVSCSVRAWQELESTRHASGLG